MTTTKLKKTLATIGAPAKIFFHAVKNAVLTNKRVNAQKFAIKLERHSTNNSAINAEKTVLFNQIIGITQGLLNKKIAEEKTKKFLDNALVVFKGYYYLSDEDVYNVLNFSVCIEGEGTATIAEIAEMYNFDAEKMLALYVGLKLTDTTRLSVSDLISSIDNGEFDFFPGVTNYENFGREVFENTPTRYKDEVLIDAIRDTLDFEQFGRCYAEYSFTAISDFGSVVIF